MNKVGGRLFVVCATTELLAASNGVMFGDEILTINGCDVCVDLDIDQPRIA